MTAGVLEKLARCVTLQLESDHLIHTRVAGRHVGILEVSAADDGFVDRAGWGARAGHWGCGDRGRSRRRIGTERLGTGGVIRGAECRIDHGSWREVLSQR